MHIGVLTKCNERIVVLDIDNAVTVRQGKCLYNNSKEYAVKIVKWHILYGTGDFEDSTDIRDDRYVECYYVLYEDIVARELFNVCGGGFLSIEEAVSSVELGGEVEWDV